MESGRLEKTSKTIQTNHPPTSNISPLNRVPQYCIETFPEQLQGWNSSFLKTFTKQSLFLLHFSSLFLKFKEACCALPFGSTREKLYSIHIWCFNNNFSKSRWQSKLFWCCAFKTLLSCKWRARFFWQKSEVLLFEMNADRQQWGYVLLPSSRSTELYFYFYFAFCRCTET